MRLNVVLAHAHELGIIHLYQPHLLTRLSSQQICQFKQQEKNISKSVKHWFTTKGYPIPNHVRSRRCCGCKQGNLEYLDHDQQVLAQ
jgi:hypothetical protein